MAWGKMSNSKKVTVIFIVVRILNGGVIKFQVYFVFSYVMPMGGTCTSPQGMACVLIFVQNIKALPAMSNNDDSCDSTDM